MTNLADVGVIIVDGGVCGWTDPSSGDFPRNRVSGVLRDGGTGQRLAADTPPS